MEEHQQGFNFDLHDFLTGPLQGSQRAPRDWNNLLTGWLLDKFDPTALLTRKATTQAPSKAAQDDWDRINCAVLGLTKQFMVRHEAGGIEPNQFYDQLLMLPECCPCSSCDETEVTRKMSSTRTCCHVVTSS